VTVPNPELEREEEEALDDINVEDQMDYIEDVQRQSLDEFIAEKSASFYASQQGTEDEVEDENDDEEEDDEIEKVEVNVPDSKYRIKIGGKFVN
jgi:hypothetical protein